MADVTLFEAPPPDPKHDILWVGIGILIGYFVISFIIKALDKLRGDRMAKLGSMVNELKDLKNNIAASNRRIASLEDDVQQRNRTIQFRDNTIANERQQRAEAENENYRLLAEAEDENDRLRPFEMEANELRPQVGTLRDEIRDKNREITSLKADIAKTRDDLQVAYQRFETVNQRAAEGKDVERNLRTFIREREVALDRIRAQHQEELDILRENHDNEIERLQQEREVEIEAVRANANSELDAIIITKNRELEMLRKQRDVYENTSFVSSHSSQSSRPAPTELGSASSLENLSQRSPASELHSNFPAHELDSGVQASELGSSPKRQAKSGAGK